MGGRDVFRKSKSAELFLKNYFKMSFFLTLFISKTPITTRYFQNHFVLKSERMRISRPLGYLKTPYQLNHGARRSVVLSDDKTRMLVE